MRHASRRALALAVATTAVFGPLAAPAAAHRDGCHRWHSCPSDTGSYVCGDLGYYSECPGGAPGDEPTTVAPIVTDYTAPDEPVTGTPAVAAGGAVALPVTAERGSTIRVSLDGRVLASVRATGSAQRVSFRAAHGARTYSVTATDGAGNASYETEVELDVDAAAPAPASVRYDAPGRAGGATVVVVRGEPGSRYTLRVRSRAGELRAFSRDGTLDSLGAASEPLLLPNGAYSVTVALRDAAGNSARAATVPLRVAIARPSLTLRVTSPANATAVVVDVTGPALGTGTLTFTSPGAAAVKAAFTLDGLGHALVTTTLPDGTWRADAAVADFQRRSAATRLADVRIDTVAPTVTATYERRAARHGEIALNVVVEDGATATVHGLPGDTPTLAGGTHPLRLPAKDGTYAVRVEALDAAGNSTVTDLRVRVSHPMTAAELAAGLFGLALLGFGLFALWWKREHVARAVWALRAAARRRALRAEHRRALAAHSGAVVAHQAARRAYDAAHEAWRGAAASLQRNADEAATFDGGPLPDDVRAKPGERAFAFVEMGSLVENRRPNGYDVPTVVERGSVLVTDRRVVFTGAKRREWLYDQLTDVTHLTNGGTMMRVTNRQNPSGVAFGTDPRGRFRLDLALSVARGDRAAFAAAHAGGLASHLASEPRPPAPLPPAPVPPPMPTAAELRAAHAARRAPAHGAWVPPPA